MNSENVNIINILLVEDNPGDVVLIREALEESRVLITLSVAVDGVEAMKFLRRQEKYAGAPRPDIVLLDLNLPRRSGREVLRDIKSDPELKAIPVVVLTSSRAEEDILKSYELQANCYIIKPVDFEKFLSVVRLLEDFWLTVVKLPPKS
jgi:two-component system response regulator